MLLGVSSSAASASVTSETQARFGIGGVVGTGHCGEEEQGSQRRIGKGKSGPHIFPIESLRTPCFPQNR